MDVVNLTTVLRTFLDQVRGRLNLRIFGGLAAVAAAAGALAGWLLAQSLTSFAGGIWSLAPVRLTVFAVVVLAVIAGAVVWNWKHRLGRDRAALWLDEAAGTQEVFAAAEGLLNVQEAGVAAQVVLQTAERQRSLLVGTSGLRYPLRRLAMRLTGAAASIAILASLLIWWQLPQLRGVAPAPSAKGTSAAAAEAEKPEAPQDLSPQEVAKQLFPNDSRLAALAEQALAAGDTEALQTLMQEGSTANSAASRALQDLIDQQMKDKPGTGTSSSPETSSDPTGRSVPVASTGPNGNPTDGKKSSASAAALASSSGQSGKENPNAPNAGGGTQGSASLGGVPQMPPNANSPPSKAGSGDTSPTAANGGGGQGTGHSDNLLGQQDLPGASDKRLVIPDKTKPGMFEVLLPGKDEFLPLDQAVAPAGKSAEAALSRKTTPLEYENTVRDYFHLLSQEVTP